MEQNDNEWILASDFEATLERQPDYAVARFYAWQGAWPLRCMSGSGVSVVTVRVVKIGVLRDFVLDSAHELAGCNCLATVGDTDVDGVALPG